MANSLERMVNMLTSSQCGWPRNRISVYLNEVGPGNLPDQLIALFEEAKDIALFYFVGHGQVDNEDQLCLSLVGTRREPHRRASTSLQFHSVRRAMLESKAASKIIILDCCFAGLANRPSNTLGTSAYLLDKASNTGAYTMAASSAYSTAWFETRARKPSETYFTKYLADLVESGIPGEGAGLPLRILFRHLQENLALDRKPLPESRNVGAGAEFIFAYNAAKSVVRTKESLKLGPGAELDVFRAMAVNLARRCESLVERQFRLLDELERRADDPDDLAGLFNIDHITTRIRRSSESLLILAGQAPPRAWNQPVPLIDILKAGVAEIEEYSRVRINSEVEIAINGGAVGDIIHIVAELTENATSFSPDDTAVRLSARRMSSGWILIDVTDHGVGMDSAALAYANWRLENPDELDETISRRMGLFVVATLAARQGIKVNLRPSPEGGDGGVTALVWLPEELVSRETQSEEQETQSS